MIVLDILSIIIFLIFITISIFNEIFDLPHNLFGFQKTPTNFPEIAIETSLFIVFGLVIIFIIISFTKKNITNQNKIIKSLEEKENLLKEIHHRIKNNLSMIASIIYLQMSSSSDQQLKNILQNLRNRIKSIILIHEKIYLSNNLDSVYMPLYFKDLLQELIKISDKKIETKLSIEKINLKQKLLIPIAIITTELVGNAIKHAFFKENSPYISISFSKTENDYSLIIKNNGSKLPNDFSIENISSLGLKLVRELVSQLSGKLTINVSPLTEFQIIFPSNL